MTTNDILANLELAPSDVPALTAKTRDALLAFLIRWEYHDAARRCLQQLLVTSGRTVSIYDRLARVHLASGEPDRALEIIRRRHALRGSNTSQAFEAQVQLAAGQVPAAQAIADELSTEHPDIGATWRLRFEISLASQDCDAAETTLRQQESLRPNLSSTARAFSRLWQERGDPTKALPWARTALARTERDEREPCVQLLRLLEELYRATGQPAQAEATTATLKQREEELLELRQALGQPAPPKADQPSTEAAPAPHHEPVDAPHYSFASAEVVAGAVELTPDENARLHQALQAQFSLGRFRPGQADAIAAVQRGESVLAVMPTGAGKSLCYQLAAQLLPGTTLVITPLIALMKDQLDGLPDDLARRATALNHTLSSLELDTRLARAASHDYKLLYAAPERLRQRPLLHALKRAGVSLLVIDEAHCVSLWGHDFRPDYLFIAKAWRELGQPPILAMTATATPRVRDDIQAALGQMRLVAIDVHRPNLLLEAHRFDHNTDKERALLSLCRELEGSGIVYARARKTCEALAGMLCSNGVSAIHYHAGVQDRAAKQDCFMDGKARIAVATIAFGMGVDKSDVRFIIHYNLPKALDNYYQEAGRAGRDGHPALCLLFQASRDRGLMTRWIREDALQVEFLRELYAAVERRLGGAGLGLVTVGDLERDLGADDTRVRVAIHFLETAGLLWRGFDLPRTAQLTILSRNGADDPDWVRLISSARLRPGQTVSRDLMTVSRQAGLDPRNIEARLLAWQDAGLLRYRGSGRNMLLSLPEPPADSRQKVAAMLADYRAGQEGRLSEMMAYAHTQGCRHGHISDYFGERPIRQCASCDNCLGEAAPLSPAARRTRQPGKRTRAAEPTPAETWVILNSMSELPYPLGRTSLARALKGAATSPVQTERFSLFGALPSPTQKGIRALIAGLEEQGMLEPFEKGRYRLLRLSAQGQAWLEANPEAPEPVPLAPKREVKAARLPSETRSRADRVSGYDDLLFEQIRAWRWEKANELQYAPFVIFHDAVLRRIAAVHPVSLDELASIKGIGPRKLERYGAEILSIVHENQHD